MWILRWCVYSTVILASLLLAMITVSLPQYDGKVRISSNYGKITIYRDEFGVPHVFADNEKASYFGIGYVHAQDRLWTTEKFRRLAKGTLAEFFGDEALPIDYFFRQMNFDSLAKQGAKKLDKDLIEDFELVAEGMNEYVKNNVLPIEYYILGIEYKPFTYVDLLEVEKFFDFIVSYNHQMEITRDNVIQATNDTEFAKKYMAFEEKYFRHNNFPTVNDEELKRANLFEKDGLFIAAKEYKPMHTKGNLSKKDIFEEVKQTLGMTHFEGSNSWVISGEHTKSGKPILSSDPHLANR